MVMSIALQMTLIAALVLTMLLVAYTIYVRVRQETFTEKRFNFVALWSCSAVILIALQAVLNVPVIEALLAQAGVAIAPADTPTKILVVGMACVYVWVVAGWARSWNGLVSEEGQRARELGGPHSFVLDGAKETLRILRRDPPSPVYQGRSLHALTLPTPMAELTFHEQVRDLIVGRWPELSIDDRAWIADGACWDGQDHGLGQPLLVVCGSDESEVKLDRLRELIAHRAKDSRVKLIAVFERFNDKASFVAALTQLAPSPPEVYSFDELIVAALPLARYKREIDRQFREEKLPGADFAVANIFVPSRAYETTVEGTDGARLAIKGEPLDLDSYLADWLVGGSLQHLALLGTYGQGKSTAALALTHRLLHDENFAARCGNRIPLLVRLTGLSPKTADAEALLGQWGYRLGLNGRALLALHRAGRTLLILDAFDEMASVADRADRFDHFAALWEFACPGAKVLFTGRPNFFLDDEELKRALGISEGVAVGPYCRALRMAPFAPDQIASSLRWMPAERVTSFMRAIDRSPQLLEIAERPSLLFQVSRLWHEGRIDIEGDRVYSGAVIRAFVTYSLERQVQKQRTEMASGRADRQFIPLTLAELDYFTCGCAVAALSEGRNNHLPVSVLRETVARLLGALPEGALPLSAGEGGALAMPLKKRLADRPDATEACVQAVRTHGVIEHDPAKQGMYKFSHKSFAEALAAEVLVFRALGLEGSSGLLWSAIRPLGLIGQGAVVMFAMDIAKNKWKHRRGAEIITSITNTPRLLAEMVYSLNVTVLVYTRLMMRIVGLQTKYIIPTNRDSRPVVPYRRIENITFVLAGGATAVGISFTSVNSFDSIFGLIAIFMFPFGFTMAYISAVMGTFMTGRPHGIVNVFAFSIAVEYAPLGGEYAPKGRANAVHEFVELYMAWASGPAADAAAGSALGDSDRPIATA